MNFSRNKRRRNRRHCKWSKQTPLIPSLGRFRTYVVWEEESNTYIKLNYNFYKDGYLDLTFVSDIEDATKCSSHGITKENIERISKEFKKHRGVFPKFKVLRYKK